MKRIILFVLASCLVLGCSRPFSTSIDLGVNNTRINIPWADAQRSFDFTFPVYSSGSWDAQIVAGGDWLRISGASGTGTGYIHCTSQPNLSGVPRAVIMEVRGQGKIIPVYIVISSADLAATELEDADLDNYLI
ncbi:MAG: BACON domain-containing protein [Bacteroidales bacterium]|nr:BACON domain-containing protein [Bacteroidales bacterium]